MNFQKSYENEKIMVLTIEFSVLFKVLCLVKKITHLVIVFVFLLLALQLALSSPRLPLQLTMLKPLMIILYLTFIHTKHVAEKYRKVMDM